MANLTDEKLMAFADGKLDPAERRKVEAVLASDPESRRRLEPFRHTGAALAPLFDKPMHEPVPKHLADFVLNYPLGTGAKVAATRRRRPLVNWLKDLKPANAGWQFAAASFVFAAGLTCGWFARPENAAGPVSPQGLVAFQDGEIFARGPLAKGLETLPSGAQARLSMEAGPAAFMRASLTFKNRQALFCRQYEIATPDNRNFEGVGCRGRDGKWALQVHLATNASFGTSGQTRPAGGADNPTLDAVVDRMMDGDALGRKEEADAIASGWK